MIIGAGSGRSGTVSLAKLLDNCNNSHITHEIEPHLPWDADKWLDHYKDRLEKWRARDEKYVGDVASYYLPYLMRHLPSDMQVVVLKRDKKEVVESFIEISGPFNNWQKDWNGRYNPIYGPCFPKFDVDSKKEGLEHYWDYYYEQVEKLKSKYPAQVKVFDIDNLNSEEGQRAIFDHVGIDKEDQKTKIPCKFNERHDRDEHKK